ncbi:MAG TPA: extracellular solute-binding protein [Anaerolineae bacterium]|nr:extracellular solute-binding protein [Anaerolineae bacterium]
MLRSRLSTLLLSLSATLLAACAGTAVSPAPPAVVPPDATPTPITEPTPTESVVRLSLWLPESLSPLGEDAGARVLKAQLAEFDARHPEIVLSVSSKKDDGPGGLLDLLRAASPVAPRALPDALVLTDTDLAIAAREGLIQPLDDLLDEQSEAELFTFARRAARIDDKRMGQPLTADFDHLVFRSDRLEAPPIDWTELLSVTLPLPFAFAENTHVSDVVLAYYEQLGGQLIDAEGQPVLTLEALTQLLTLYRDARASGVITASSLNWANHTDAWAAFRASGAPFTIARASRYLSARRNIVALGYARLPALDSGSVPPIGRSWNLALVARDPRQQALVAELIEYLADAAGLAAWTQAAHVLPASSEALNRWDQSDGYAAFARDELSRATPAPSPAVLEAISPAFLGAIREALAGRITPQAAASSAIEAVPH